MRGTTRIILFVSLAIVIGFAFGCASKGVMPTEKFTNAETAIRSAQAAEARSYAPLELRIAEDKLAEAQAAATREEYASAGKLADESLVNAQLAEKKTGAEKAKRASKEMRETIDTLRRAAKEPLK